MASARCGQCHHVVGDDRICFLANYPHARRIFQNGGDPVRWLLSVTADVMVVIIFVRIIFNDFKDWVFRKVRRALKFE